MDRSREQVLELRRIGAGRVDGRGVVGEVGGDNGADDAANVGSLRQFDMRRRIVCSLLPAGMIGPPKEPRSWL